MKPVNNRVILKPKPRETTKSGIIIPDSVVEDSVQGIVVAVGENTDGLVASNQISPGDTVVYTKNSAIQFTHDGQELLILRMDDILLIL